MNTDIRELLPSNARLVVLTGGPCSGKSTILAELERSGHPVVSEAAKDLLEDSVSAELRHGDPLAFQRLVLARQLAKEKEAVAMNVENRVIFADRGIGDHFAYLRRAGLDPFPELLAAWTTARERYRAILLCAPSPHYQEDTHRAETPDEARAIHRALEDEYRLRHWNVIPVPWCPLVDRVEIVLRATSSLL